ncbi:conserved hypothetical protein [Cellulomonas flavigena DSM 20109]|uniref:DUF3105 domain-containing protein n=1 Tax=Cellulomonas flavigena (strain ATCC 482 / DSM 20109 / BCRC 11376 / JCM 18109 / NBRC 3775 / NCIMB 8073 / NRS 134) TaxID=446466 RepID=D5UE74_CELFN|nr:DUF3105 domain-containing protein [Cellulomonas flavigena]ADG76550.1 conserved hypothetical protein [Cellulomonas flavigena DSM 20109]
MSAASKRTSTREDRAARLALIQAEQRAAERRRTRRWVVVSSIVVLAVAAPTTFVIAGEARRDAEVADVAARPIAGEQQVDVAESGHVPGEVDYQSETPADDDRGVLPPIGGDHDQIPQNCGYYTEPVRDENAVHSLEHGAVWVTYRDDVSATDRDRLRDLAEKNPYLLVTPYTDLAAPVVATAWGVQLEVDSALDDRLEPFLVRYLESEDAPEPGAPCSGGVGV